MVDKPVSVAWGQMAGEPDKGTDPTDLSVSFLNTPHSLAKKTYSWILEATGDSLEL